MIAIEEMNGKNWWKGRLGTSVGIFPVKYVMVLPVHKNADIWRDKLAHIKVKASFDHHSLEPDELSFREGDTIRYVKLTSREWCLGDIRGQQGLRKLIFKG